MEDDFHSAAEILNKYGQEQLLSFYHELNDAQRDMLIHQISSINFEQITNLYKNSYIENDDSSDIITPLPHIDKSSLSSKEINYYEQIGINAIKNGELAVITLSGGQRHKTSVIRDPKAHLNLTCLLKRNLYLRY